MGRRIVVGVALVAALQGLACANFVEQTRIAAKVDAGTATPEEQASYDAWRMTYGTGYYRAPHKSYEGPARARDRIAVVLIQQETLVGRGWTSSSRRTFLRLASIDAASVTDVYEDGYAVLPGPHTLEVTQSGTRRATLQVDAAAGGLYGVRIEPDTDPSRAGSVEFVDLRSGTRLVSAPLPPEETICGLGFELVLPLALLGAWQRRARRRARSNRARREEEQAGAEVPLGGVPAPIGGRSRRRASRP